MGFSPVVGCVSLGRMSRPRATILLYPGCIFLEIAAAAEILAEHCELGYFTPIGEVHEASNGLRIMATGSYADAAERAAACVVVPGGNPDSIIEPGSASECLRAAHRGGAVMAGICAGALVLARAGLLRGRRATHGYTAEHATAEVVACTAPIFEGIRFERADVVVDPPFITAQYWAAGKFAAAIAEAIGVFSAKDVAAYLHRYGRSYDRRQA